MYTDSVLFIYTLLIIYMYYIEIVTGDSERLKQKIQQMEQDNVKLIELIRKKDRENSELKTEVLTKYNTNTCCI